MDLIKHFETEDGILALSVDFTYSEATPFLRLYKCAASIEVTGPDDEGGSPPASPPSGSSVVNVALSGETKFDFRDSGTNAFGTISLTSFSGGSASGGVWLNIFYGTDGIRHFEGITMTFDWTLATARS